MTNADVLKLANNHFEATVVVDKMVEGMIVKNPNFYRILLGKVKRLNSGMFNWFLSTAMSGDPKGSLRFVAKTHLAQLTN